MGQLDELAGLAGIEPGYFDIWGNYVEIPAATKMAILEAMGLPAGDEAACAAAIAELRTRPWRRMIDPAVVIAAERQPAALEVTVPQTALSGRLEWALDLEDGTSVMGGVPLGDLQQVDECEVDGAFLVRCRFDLPTLMPVGYHRLKLDAAGTGSAGGTPCESTLIVAPKRCWTPEDIDPRAPDRRYWGISCQLYALRSEGDWGIGDFSCLGDLAELAARHGAHVVGLNPLHALFPTEPDLISPYAPSSRLFLNTLYIRPEDVPDLAESPEAQAIVAEADVQDRLRSLRTSQLVDYPGVAALLERVLRALYRSFCDKHLTPGTKRAQDFRAFRREAGPGLRQFATFHALQAHFAETLGKNHIAWWTWPEKYRRGDGERVKRFVDHEEEQVTYYEYLQWIADDQLARASERARQGGMRIGLYRDLAVGETHGSVGAWAEPGAFLRGVSVGAPPDMLNLLGQNWGLCPFNPVTLRQSAFEPVISALRSNMRHAGALRIDHVMGLMHQFWVPQGFSATQGAYVTFPFDDLRRILALESQRQRCLVIGEDLGTVPDGFRPVMAEAGVLSYRIFQFERVGDGLFKRPAAYPERALVTAGTHDLPPLAGFWQGRDLEWRRSLNLYPSDEVRDADASARSADRQRLLDALIDAGLWPSDRRHAVDEKLMDRALLEAIQRYLAGTPSRIMMLQIEDAVGQVEQQNLPGTQYEHPNWRLRLTRTLPAIFSDPDVPRLLETVDRLRRQA